MQYPAEDFDQLLPRFSLSLLTEEQYKLSSAKMLTLSNASPTKIPRRLVVIGWSERIIRAVLQRDTSFIDRWELLGWTSDIPKTGLRYVITFVKLWVRPGFAINH
jgi:hypothetical protein